MERFTALSGACVGGLLAVTAWWVPLPATAQSGSSSSSSASGADEPGFGPLSQPERPLRFDPPAATDQPNPWACTAGTLLDEKSCIFDSSAKPGGDKRAWRKKNAKVAADLGAQLCPELSRGTDEVEPDPELLKACLEAINDAGTTCGRVDDRALLDEQGRFSPTAGHCYARLRDATQRVRQAADVWSGCCQCLASSGCAPSKTSCALNLAQGNTSGPARTCVQEHCAGTCRPVLLLTEPPRKSTGYEVRDVPDPEPVDDSLDL